ncbi:MAG: FAD-dependent oxidoreductase [Syntrophomonas sp.]|nr:FAD-dependent oxidoreductase [Syntrophomonas sp.]
MITMKINDTEIQASAGQTILQAARAHNIDIPTLCYDERVKIYGGCGICMVEIEGLPKLQRACATQIAPGMQITTDNARIRAARKVTLELMLSDHVGDCRPPCVKACPGETDCQGYVGLIANGEHREALKVIKEQLPLPTCIGLVCPHPCETACRRQLVDAPVAIAALKVFAGEFDLYSGNPFVPELKAPSGQKVAIVGSGPAGLTAAYFLAVEGHQITVLEAMPQPGGMLRYGIPEYRLPKRILDQEIDIIKSMGVEIKTNTKLGTDISLEELRNNFDAVFLGIGAWQYSKMNCPGEDLPGVIGGIDFLRDVALRQPVQLGDRVAVIGGGNTAMDACRSAVRLGAKEVMVLYRRTREEMPAEDLEINEAMEEGVEFRYLVAPIEILADNGRAAAIRLQQMQLGEPDASGRRSPVPIPGAEEIIAVDSVIAAIGQQVDMRGCDGVEASRWRAINIDDNTFMTNLPGVFAGGDGVTGPGIAIAAIGQGKKAATVMSSYLAGQTQPFRAPFLVEKTGLTRADFAQVEPGQRVTIEAREPALRRTDFQEVAGRMSEAAARQEGGKCMECGCRDWFECKLIDYANQYEVQPGYLQGEKHRVVEPDPHPFIARDAAKCILCGLCVRFCDEYMGINALGLVERGFETVVEPEFGLPLQESSCISCGQCVAVCPTGALLENYPQPQNVPVKAQQTPTVCSFCGLGCKGVAESCGAMTIRMLPPEEGILCAKGRFGFGELERERLTRPLVRKDGRLQEVSWEEAIATAAAGLGRVNGPIAITASLSLTCEEAGLAALLGETLGASLLAGCSDYPSRGLSEVWGINFAAPALVEMDGAEVILMVGSFNHNQVLPVRVRQAVKRGTRLIVLSDEPTLVDDIAALRIRSGNTTEIIKQIIAALIEERRVDEQLIEKAATGWVPFREQLAAITPSDEARQAARIYGGSARAMIIADGFTVSAAGVTLLADLAIVASQATDLNTGVVVINPGGNSTGVWQAGFSGEGQYLVDSIRSNEIRSAVIIGEDPTSAGVLSAQDLARLDWLVVLSPFLTATAAQAEVVFPSSTPLETRGTYISADGRVAALNKVTDPLAGRDTASILVDLIAAVDPVWAAQPRQYSRESISEKVASKQPFGSSSPDLTLPVGQARLVIPAPSPLFVPPRLSDPALIRFNKHGI